MGKSSKSTTSNEPSAFAKGYITPAATTLGAAFQQAAPGVAEAQSAITAGIPGIAAKAFGDQPGLDAANTYNSDVLGGKYLGQGNPYLQSQIDATDSSVADRVNAQFGAAGRTGSGANTYELARALGQNESALRYSDYGNERQAMGQAVSQTPALLGAQYAGVSPLLGLAGGTMLGQDSAARYASGVGGLVGQYNNKTDTSTPSAASSISQGIGTALQVASLFSDRRLKTNVERVATLHDGLGVYDFDYRPDAPVDVPMGRQRGVMADEVATLRPWALGEPRQGFATVDYGRL